VKSRKEYLDYLKEFHSDVVIDDSAKISTDQSNNSVQEEQAKLLIGVFGKLTSAVYDVNSICDLFKKREQTKETKVVLAHALSASLANIRTNVLG